MIPIKTANPKGKGFVDVLSFGVDLFLPNIFDEREGLLGVLGWTNLQNIVDKIFIVGFFSILRLRSQFKIQEMSDNIVDEIQQSPVRHFLVGEGIFCVPLHLEQPVFLIDHLRSAFLDGFESKPEGEVFVGLCELAKSEGGECGAELIGFVGDKGCQDGLIKGLKLVGLADLVSDGGEVLKEGFGPVESELEDGFDNLYEKVEFFSQNSHVQIIDSKVQQKAGEGASGHSYFSQFLLQIILFYYFY